MPGPITQEYVLKGTAQFDDIQRKVSQTQNFLNGLKLSPNLKASFTQTFAQLQGSIQKATNLMQQGFTTKGTLTAFNKEINNITLGFDKLNRDMSKISDAKLKESLKTTQEYQEALSKIKLEKSSAADLQGEGLKAYNQSLIEVYKNIEKISQFKGFNTFRDAFESGNFEGAKEALGTIQQHLSKFKSADSIQKMTTYVGQLKTALEGAEKATAEETQRLRDLENAEQTLDAQGVQELKNKIESLQQEIETLKTNAKGAGDSINAMGQKTVQAASSLDQFKSRIQYFFGLNNAVNLVRRGIQNLFNTIKELDKVMTETAVVTDYTVGQMWNKLPANTARANELGVAIKEIYEADTLYYQQGLKTQQVQELSNETMKMARIAGLGAKDATDRMTNALRAFNMELNETNAQRINDVYSALAARTASNVQEISSAMTKVASLANSANMSFENTAAFLAQIVETTRESAETAGTALKTVIARFSEVKKLVSENELTGQTEEGEEINVNKVGEALRAANIDLNEYLTGAKGLDEIFIELSSKWDSLDIVTQRYIATMAAGSRQQSRFIALMQDYSRMQELTGIATNANGASQQQFEKTLESLETKLNKLKNAWDQFLMGIANAGIIKLAVDALTWLINAINNMVQALSFGKEGLKSFWSALVLIAGFKLGKAIFTKAFAGIGAIMRGEGLKAGAAWNSGFSAGIVKRVGLGKLVAKSTKQVTLSMKESLAITKKEVAANKTLIASDKGVMTAKRAKGEAWKNYNMAVNTYGQNSSQAAKAGKALAAAQQEEQAATAAATTTLAANNVAKGLSLTAQTAYSTAVEAGIAPEKALMGVQAGLTGEEIIQAAAISKNTGETIENVIAKMAQQKEANKGLIALTKSIISQWLHNGSVQASTILAWKDVAAQTARRLAMLGLAGAIIAAAAATVALIVSLFTGGESAAEFAKRMRASAEQCEERAKALRERYEDLQTGLEDLQEKEDTLDGLTEGTEEWYKALEEVNNQVRDLVKEFPELAQYVEVANGKLSLNEEGVQQYLEEMKQMSFEADMASLGADLRATRAEARATGYELIGDDSQKNQLIARAMNGDADAIAKFVESGDLTEEQARMALSGDAAQKQELMKQLGANGKNDLSEYIAYGQDLAKADAKEKAYAAQRNMAIGNSLETTEENFAAAQRIANNLGNEYVDSSKDWYSKYTLEQLKSFNSGVDTDEYKAMSAELEQMKADMRAKLIAEGATDIEIKDDKITYKLGDEEKEIKNEDVVYEQLQAKQANQMKEMAEDRLKKYDKLVAKTEATGNKDQKQFIEHMFAADDGKALTAEDLAYYNSLSQQEQEKISQEINSILGSVTTEDIKNYKDLAPERQKEIENWLKEKNIDISQSELLSGDISDEIQEQINNAIQNELAAGGEMATSVTAALNNLLDQIADARQFHSTAEKMMQDAEKAGVSHDYLIAEQARLTKVLAAELGKSEDDVSELAGKLAARNAVLRKSMQDLISTADKWKKLIRKDGSLMPFTTEDQEVFDEYVDNFNKMFNISEDLDKSFYQNAGNVKLLQEALDGSTEAYYKLAKLVAAQQLNITVGLDGEKLDKETLEELKEIQQEINDFDFTKIEPGVGLDDTEFVKKLQGLLDKGKIAADKVEEILGGLNISFDISEEELKDVYVGKAGNIVESRDLLRTWQGKKQLGQTKLGYDDWLAQEGYKFFKTYTKHTINSTSMSDVPDADELDIEEEKPTLNLSQEDEYYNKLKKIEALEQRINDINEERNALLETSAGNVKKYTDALKKELDLTAEQLELTQQLQLDRQQQLVQGWDRAANGSMWRIEGKNLNTGEDELINVADYFEYVHWDQESQTVYFDVDRFNALVDDNLKSNISAVKDALESVADEYNEYNSKILVLEQKQLEILKESQSAYKSIEESTVEALVWERQKVIDELSSINENINNAQSEIMDSIQKQIDLERQIRDNTKKEDEISDIENQIAFLSRDTSGANQVRLKELNKQLEDLTEEYQDTLIDQELQRIQDDNETAQKQRERQIEILEKSLEYDQQRGIFNKMAYDLINEAYADGVFAPGDKLYDLMYSYYGKEGASDVTITSDMKDFTDNLTQAKTYMDEMVSPTTVAMEAFDELVVALGLTADEAETVRSALKTGILPPNWVQMVSSDLASMRNTIAQYQNLIAIDTAEGLNGIFDSIMEMSGRDDFGEFLGSLITELNDWKDENIDDPALSQYLQGLTKRYQEWAKDPESQDISELTAYLQQFPNQFNSWYEIHKNDQDLPKYLNNLSKALTDAVNINTNYAGLMNPYITKLNQATDNAIKMVNAKATMQTYIDKLNNCIATLDFSVQAKNHLQQLWNGMIMSIKSQYVPEAYVPSYTNGNGNGNGNDNKKDGEIDQRTTDLPEMPRGRNREVGWVNEKRPNHFLNYEFLWNAYKATDENISYLGWVKKQGYQEAHLDQNGRISTAYATGGLNTQTGPAWLDGTPSKPEYILNPAQTQAFLQLPDLLKNLNTNPTNSFVMGDTNIEINITVEELANDYDVEQLADKIKNEIYEDSTYRNVNTIGWIR